MRGNIAIDQIKQLNIAETFNEKQRESRSIPDPHDAITLGSDGRLAAMVTSAV